MRPSPAIQCGCEKAATHCAFYPPMLKSSVIFDVPFSPFSIALCDAAPPRGGFNFGVTCPGALRRTTSKPGAGLAPFRLK